MIYDARDAARLRNGVLMVSVLAWGYLAMAPEETSCHGPGHAFGTSLHGSLEALVSRIPGWTTMLVAMMAPMTLGGLYQIRISSFAGRRWRSSLLFVLGYYATWSVAAIVLASVELTAARLAPQSSVPALAVGLIAVIWQASPIKQRCLNRCHDHRPLAAFGWAADRDAARMGLEHGVWCVGSCWAAMLVPMLLPQGHFAAMLAVTLLMICERLDPPQAPRWRLRGFRTAFRVLRLRLWGPQASPAPFIPPAAS